MKSTTNKGNSYRIPWTIDKPVLNYIRRKDFYLMHGIMWKVGIFDMGGGDLVDIGSKKDPVTVLDCK